MDVLTPLRERNLTLDVERDRLIVSPASRLTDADREYIRAHKPELIAALTIEQIQRGIVPDHYTATTECRRCGPVPIFPGLPAKVGSCPWCFARVRGVKVPKA